jgi:5-methylthioribose kinase
LGDRSLFDELRVDPYYRNLAEHWPEAREAVGRLINSLEAHPRSLVHADFSPKNMLLFDTGQHQGMMLVDFETGHYGDPAFDLGFFLSHLVLKACYHMPDHARYLELSEAFRRTYDQRMRRRVDAEELTSLWTRGIQNFAACAWARLDGKSPVDYLDDPARRESVRTLCRHVLAQQPTVWSQVVELADERFTRVTA